MKKNTFIFGLLLVISLMFAGCALGQGSLLDGAYAGEGEGYSSTIKINIAVEGGKISGLQVVEHGETDEIFNDAVEKIREDIIGKESTEEIDLVSGATSTSKGIIEAINKAAAKAK